MAVLAIRSPTFSACSVLMSLLFAYSASVQLNDPDWYFWFPLYGLAFGVNLLSVGFSTSKTLSQVAVLVLSGGVLLLFKVLVEDYIHGLAGLWSLDMRERFVREKLGSGLVVMSMLLHLKASHPSDETKKERRDKGARFAESGMVMLVAVSLGLTMHFFSSVQQQHMKF